MATKMTTGEIEGAPFTAAAAADASAAVRARKDALPTPVGADPGPLAPMGWEAEYGLDLATAAKVMASGADPGGGPLVLPYVPLEFDLRLENRFEQRMTSRERRDGDPIPRPSGRGEGADLVGRRIADAIRAVEYEVIRKK